MNNYFVKRGTRYFIANGNGNDYDGDLRSITKKNTWKRWFVFVRKCLIHGCKLTVHIIELATIGINVKSVSHELINQFLNVISQLALY